MNKREKDIILFTLLILIWIGAVVALVLGFMYKNIASQIIGIVGSPLLSQLFGMWPKIIHYRKVNKRVQDIEEMHKEVKELKEKNVVNRSNIFKK